MEMQMTGIQSRPTTIKKLNQKVPYGRGKMKVADAHSLSDASVYSASNLITAGKEPSKAREQSQCLKARSQGL